MIQEFGRIGRPFFVMLAIVTILRWLMGTSFGIPFDPGTHYFSIVVLTLMGSLFSTAYLRRWLGFSIGRAAAFAMFLALVAQVVILAATAASYALGVQTYFNHPRALNQPEAVGVGAALGIRAMGLVVNTIMAAIAGALGWALGGLIPAADTGRSRT